MVAAMMLMVVAERMAVVMLVVERMVVAKGVAAAMMLISSPVRVVVADGEAKDANSWLDPQHIHAMFEVILNQTFCLK